MLKPILPDDVEVNITNDDIRLKSKLTTNKTIRFTKRSYFQTILSFTQSHSGVLGDTKGFVQLIPGSYKSDKSLNITGIDKILLKCDCINRSMPNSTREPSLYRFSLEKPPGHEIYKKSRNKFLTETKKSILFHITFY